MCVIRPCLGSVTWYLEAYKHHLSSLTGPHSWDPDLVGLGKGRVVETLPASQSHCLRKLEIPLSAQTCLWIWTSWVEQQFQERLPTHPFMWPEPHQAAIGCRHTKSPFRAQGFHRVGMCPVLKDQRPGQEHDFTHIWILSQQLCLLQRKAKRAHREFYSLEFRGILMTTLSMIVLESDWAYTLQPCE